MPQAITKPLFEKPLGLPEGATVVNGRVWFQDFYGLRVVLVDQLTFHRFPVDDAVQTRFVAAQLVEAGLAQAREVCAAFGLAGRTFSRVRRQLRDGGIGALVEERRGPQGRRPATQQVAATIVQLYQQGQSVYDVGTRVGVCPRTVGRVLKEAGIARRGHRTAALPWGPAEAMDAAAEVAAGQAAAEPREPVASEPVVLGDGGAAAAAARVPEDGATSAGGQEPVPATVATPEAAGVGACSATPVPAVPAATAGVEEPAVVATSLPYAAPLDRLYTTLRLIEEAPVVFAAEAAVPQAGALFGLAFLDETHLVSEARAVYGRLQPAWYGLRSLLWTLVVMALLRIKAPEQIKLHDPAALGAIVGLPRAAEVKTLRRKVEEVAGFGRAAELHRRLAQRRAAESAATLVTLYVDGHVRAYHGKYRLGTTHIGRTHRIQRAETDYWVHQPQGRPLLVVHDAANAAFTAVLRDQVLPEIRRVVGDRRVTVIFDRAGWSRELFAALLDAGFDFITYRKGPYAPLAESQFQHVTVERDGHTVPYELAEDVLEQEGWPKLRVIAVKKKSGGQTHILASGRATWAAWPAPAVSSSASPSSPAPPTERPADLPPAEVAWWMFGRWCQENWLKYMRAEYGLDLLVEHGVEPAADREVPNAAWRKLDRQVRTARTAWQRAAAHALELQDHTAAQRAAASVATMTDAAAAPPPCAGCGKCLPCRVARQTALVAETHATLERLLAARAATPRRIPLSQAPNRDAVQLRYEQKLFTDTVKLCAYEIETRLYTLVSPTYARSADEGRALIRDILQTPGTLRCTGDRLEVHLDQLATPRATEALIGLCTAVNALAPRLPETPLRLHFTVNPRPIGE
jgi:hypothetical protein